LQAVLVSDVNERDAPQIGECGWRGFNR
jgi:hypothetical protein